VQAAEKARHEEKSAVVVNGGISEVRADRVSAILRVNASEVLRYFVEGFVPADASPASGNATHRIFQTVIVVMNILESDGLRADVTAAEWIVFVPTNRETLVSFDLNLDATDRLAKIASAIVWGPVVHAASLSHKKNKTSGNLFVFLCLFVAAGIVSLRGSSLLGDRLLSTLSNMSAQ
jgi:hypothetical protein